MFTFKCSDLKKGINLEGCKPLENQIREDLLEDIVKHFRQKHGINVKERKGLMEAIEGAIREEPGV